MFSTYNAIVLHTLAYTESKRIVHCFTEENGRQSFMLFVKSKSKDKGMLAQFQPLSNLKIEAKTNAGNDLFTIRNFSALHHCLSLVTNPVKQLQSLFIAEVSYNVLNRETCNPPIYKLLEYTTLFLDTSVNHQWVHVKFLIELCALLGFNIQYNTTNSNTYFNPVTGCFEDHHNIQCVSREASEVILFLAETSQEQIEHAQPKSQLLSPTIDALVQFYTHHVSGFKPLKTVAFFRQM